MIEPAARNPFGAIASLWPKRELVGFLIWKDVKVRYRQSLLGVGWAVLQPLVLMSIFGVFLSGVVERQDSEIPYWLFVFAGLAIWTPFAQALMQSANSIVNQPDLVRKASFPRIVVPVAAVGPYFVDFLVGSSIAAVLTLTVTGSIEVRALVGLVGGLLALSLALAIGVGLSALNVRYRDVRFVAPFFVQALIFTAPIVYPLSMATERLRPFIWMNPLTGIVELYRWALFGDSAFPVGGLVVAVLVTLAILILSSVYFAMSEPEFADVI